MADAAGSSRPALLSLQRGRGRDGFEATCPRAPSSGAISAASDHPRPQLRYRDINTLQACPTSRTTTRSGRSCSGGSRVPRAACPSRSSRPWPSATRSTARTRAVSASCTRTSERVPGAQDASIRVSRAPCAGWRSATGWFAPVPEMLDRVRETQASRAAGRRALIIRSGADSSTRCAPASGRMGIASLKQFRGKVPLASPSPWRLMPYKGSFLGSGTHGRVGERLVTRPSFRPPAVDKPGDHERLKRPNGYQQPKHPTRRTASLG
jgi:hypothetical protein